MLKLTMEKWKYSEDLYQVRRRYLRYLEALRDDVLVGNHNLYSCQRSVKFIFSRNIRLLVSLLFPN